MIKLKNIVEETLKEFIERELSGWQIGSGSDAHYVEKIENYFQTQKKMWLAFSEFAIKAGRKQLAEEVLNDSRLNSQINEAGIRIIIKEKLKKEVGNLNPNYIDGRSKKGYFKYKIIRIDNKLVPEHRYMMEKKIGRKLTKDDVVHHIDGNPKNNHPDNQLFVDTSTHIKFHRQQIKEIKQCDQAILLKNI